MDQSYKYTEILKEFGLKINDLQSSCEEVRQTISKTQTENYDKVVEIFQEFSNDVRQLYIPNKFTCHTKINAALECYLLSMLHDTIMPIFYKFFKDEDEIIFNQSLKLQYVQFPREFDSINLPASIVELASLDSHKTVHDKMTCLSSCFDLIYAEMKLAMVEAITQNEDESKQTKEIEIPIVDNADVIPLMTKVIAKAKCQHLYSNLYFIQSLSNLHFTNKDYMHILASFSTAIETLLNTSRKDCAVRKTNSEMDLKQYMTMMESLTNFSITNKFERLSLTRLSRQISKSHESIN